MSYAIIVTERFGVKGFAIPREYPTESIAIDKAMMHFRNGSLHKVIVVDGSMKIVFSQIRKCKCMNVQQVLTADGVHYHCIECNVLINHELWRKKLYGVEASSPTESGRIGIEEADTSSIEADESVTAVECFVETGK